MLTCYLSKGYIDLLFYFCNFSVSLKLLQNKKLFLEKNIYETIEKLEQWLDMRWDTE